MRGEREEDKRLSGGAIAVDRKEEQDTQGRV